MRVDDEPPRAPATLANEWQKLPGKLKKA